MEESLEEVYVTTKIFLPKKARRLPANYPLITYLDLTSATV